MSEKQFITNYIKHTVWPNGGVSLSFVLDDYVKQKIAEAPTGAMVGISQKLNPTDKNTHYMTYKVLEQKGQQQAQAPAQAPY